MPFDLPIVFLILSLLVAHIIGLNKASTHKNLIRIEGRKLEIR